jgi:hypothetical protein
MELTLGAGQVLHVKQLIKRDYRWYLDLRQRSIALGLDTDVEECTLQALGQLTYDLTVQQRSA